MRSRLLVPLPSPRSPDADLISSADSLPQAQQWNTFRQAVENSHNAAHGFFGVSTIGDAHTSFEDPFVYLLHSNVDRLFAMWQAQPGQEWRLDPDQVYGDQSETTGEGGILTPLQPWDGTVVFGAPIEPWVGASPQIEVKTCRDSSVVQPRCYDTLPLTVDQVAPAPGDPLRFLDVVELLPTARALRVRVRGCAAVTVNASVTAGFSLLSASVTAPHPEGYGEQDLLVWVLFTPGAAGSVANGTLTATVVETGQVLTIPITATVVPNPTVGTSLVLDRSGSMSSASGLPGKDRMDVLHDSAPLFVALLDSDDGVGVVRFDTDAVKATPVTSAVPMIGGTGRLNASAAITSTSTNPTGMTAIGDGLEAAVAQLASVATNYDSTATIVFTDGHETADKTIAAAASSVNSRVFAIGLGTADQLNPGALSDIANGTGGFLLLTGNPGIDDQLLLQKYFAQVLAGATNSAIVVDPSGLVPLGGQATIPFLLTDADIRADILVLGELASTLRVELVAPDGTTLTAGAGADEVVGDAYRVLRVVPADVLTPPSAAGRWKVVLTVDRTGLDTWLGQLRERLSRLENKDRAAQILRLIETGIKINGVPYTVSVQARSGLTMRVAVTQHSRLPGTPGTVQAVLTDSGIPLEHSALVAARVTDPDGTTRLIPMPRTGEGTYQAAVSTSGSGVYQVLVSALGSDLRGTAFTREELRTLAVWARGDEPPPVVIDPSGGQRPHLDTCGLLLCLLNDKTVRAFLNRQEIDADALGRCVKRACGQATRS